MIHFFQLSQSMPNLIQWLLIIVVGVGSWFMHELWDAVKDLKSDLSDVKVSLAKEYVTKDDYKADIGRIHELLDKIYDKLDNKADRLP